MMKHFRTLLMLFLLSSCTFIRMDDSIDLGSKYRYIQDYPQTIVYHRTEKYEGVGLTVIEPIVLSYDYNEKYIIAKSQEHVAIKQEGEAEKPILYWIIDKSSDPKNIKPMDSLSFYRQVEYLKIELELKER